MHKTPYSDRIASMVSGFDPGQVEAFMRLEHGTLDHLRHHDFYREVTMACACIAHDPEMAVKLATSYGL